MTTEDFTPEAVDTPEVETAAEPVAESLTDLLTADSTNSAEPEPAAPSGDADALATMLRSEAQAAAGEPVEQKDPDNAKAAPATAAEVAKPPEAAPVGGKKWYVVKVASGREESIKNAILRKIKIEGLEQHFGQIVIPVERITEVKKVVETKGGEKKTKEKRVVKEKKKYPGYLMAEVEFTDEILYVFRDTNGVGDFVGATGPLKAPPPMSDREVAVMLGTELSVKDDEKLGGRKPKIKVKIDLDKGDKVRLRDGAFAGTEGEVMEIQEAKDDTETPKITVEVQFWGRPVKIDSLEYWQVDKV
jgi:transcriptional antiterminator NusG